jgi:serine/threonine-protein kinase
VAVNPGDILSTPRTKYRVDELIGRGGMGHVFAATDLGFAAPPGPVAIKVVSRLVFDETLMVRLHREAEAAARIRSEYVPRVLEVSDTADHELFLVMERLVGEPLSQHMRDKGPLPWSEVVQIGEDVLRGLIDAHTAGVVHRDLKPSNVFLAAKGGRTRAMVLDFGVCKMDTVDTERLTGTGESIGTVAYMAPEQIRGASKVDDRADLYAFGVLVFEMLCAQLPHDGPSQMAILASKLESAPARVRDCARVATPAGLDELVARALVREPAQRFASAQEMLKAWRKLGVADVAPAPQPAVVQGVPVVQGAHDARGLTRRLSAENPDVVPLEPHATQTALTQGISLRKGGGGRAAFGLAATALVAGVICVAAFFARAPEVTGARATVAAGAAESFGAPEESADASTVEEDETVSGATIELDAEASGIEISPANASGTNANGANANGAAAPRKRSRRVKPRPASATPSVTAPHITSQPRY